MAYKMNWRGIRIDSWDKMEALPEALHRDRASYLKQMERDQMVERTKSEGVEEFVGVLKTIEIEDSKFGQQYHLQMEPVDKSILKESKTGMFHEWLRITEKTTETSVPEGSVLDNYLKAVERVFRDAKSKKTILKVLEMLKDKKILYVREKLGKSFGGHEAGDHWVPTREEK
jgi:hypothetical protein